MVARADGTELIERTGLASTDGAQVESAAVLVFGRDLYLEFEYSTTGSPTGVEVRGAVEMSVDGENWHQAVRFLDKTDTSGAVQVARMSQAATGSVVDLAGADLSAADASGTLVDGAKAPHVRLVSRLVTLSGGTDPTVDIRLRVATSG